MSFVKLIVTVVCLSSCILILSAKPTIDDYRECSSSDDCGDDECCVLSHSRFSVPRCRPQGQVGDYCYSNAEPVNRTLSYPSGEVLSFSNIFIMFCPCQEGSACSGHTCHKKMLFDDLIYDEVTENSVSNDEYNTNDRRV